MLCSELFKAFCFDYFHVCFVHGTERLSLTVLALCVGLCMYRRMYVSPVLHTLT